MLIVLDVNHWKEERVYQEKIALKLPLTSTSLSFLREKSVLIPVIYDLEIADRYVVIGCSLNETIACCIRLMITLGHGSIYDEECVDRCAVRNDSMLKHSWLVR